MWKNWRVPSESTVIMTFLHLKTHRRRGLLKQRSRRRRRLVRWDGSLTNRRARRQRLVDVLGRDVRAERDAFPRSARREVRRHRLPGRVGVGGWQSTTRGGRFGRGLMKTARWGQIKITKRPEICHIVAELILVLQGAQAKMGIIFLLKTAT